jgi:hypothetical protein
MNKKYTIGTNTTKEPIGLGGWLILVLIIILSGIYSSYTGYLVESSNILFMGYYGETDISNGYWRHKILLFVISIALLYINIISLILFAAKRVIFIKWFLIYQFSYFPLNIIYVYTFNSIDRIEVEYLYFNNGIFSILYIAILLSYTLKSRRIKLTFTQ